MNCANCGKTFEKLFSRLLCTACYRYLRKEGRHILFPRKPFPPRSEAYKKALSERQKGKPKSPEAVAKMAASRRKSSRVVWSGGVKVYTPKHPRADKTGRIYEHRFLMERHLGRYLLANEVVHHINGNHFDNRIENLVVMTTNAHTAFHHKNGDIHPSSRLPKTRKH